jgi:hypothetical protein
MIEESWSAVMHTVLLNTDFNPLVEDARLRRAISKFKIWFLEFSLRGITKRELDKPPRIILKNWDKMLSALKTVAAWFQYYSLDDATNNLRPPQLPWFLGWDNQRASPTFPWMGGHLQRWRNIEGLNKSDRDLRTLCQIRTFGRALPPPSSKTCIEDLKIQACILTKDNPVDPTVLQRIREVSSLIWKRYNVKDLSRKSHISVSTSGCFEVSQRDGGLARYVQNFIKEIDIPLTDLRVLHDGEIYDFIDHYTENSVEQYNDCYGIRVFPRRSILLDDDTTVLDALYRKSGHTRARELVREHLGKLLLPNEVCPSILLMASSEALEQGYFALEDGSSIAPDFELLLPSGRKLPIWADRRIKRYVCEDFPRVQMQALAEPGAKSRSLGKNQAWFVLTTKIMRFMIEPVLAKDGRARIGLRSTNKMWSFLKFLGKTEFVGKELWLQSTDYKASTDYIALLVLSAMWEPCFEQVPRNHPFLVYKDLVLCRRSLHFSGKFEECCPTDNVHRCGSFMGEPMSFMSLTLINLIIEELTSFYWLTGCQFPYTPVDSLVSKDPIAICGDDFASIRGDLKKILLFKLITASVGMKLSYKDGVSRRVLIFCEDHILVTKERKFLYVDVVKSRLLTTMCRQHSENRSSILGKGRMLTNQLDYFDDQVIRIFIMKIFDLVFDRSHNYVMKDMTLPYFLPPSCGGMGYPIEDSVIPEFAYPYFGYIFKLLEEPNIMVRYSSILELQVLNKRNKHGIDNSDNIVSVFKSLASKTNPLKFHKGEISCFEINTLYDAYDVSSLLTGLGIDIPKDPYTGGFDRDSVRNEAQRFGIIPFSEYLTQIERTLNFQEFLKDESVLRSQRTFEQWIRRSGKFWKRELFSKPLAYRQDLARIGKERFVDLKTLDRVVNRQFDGYIFPGNWMSLAEAGPSLQIDFRVLSTRPQKYFLKRYASIPVGDVISPILRENAEEGMIP